MAEVRRNPLAREDLIEIWTYVALDKPDAADRLLDSLEARFETLARNPNIGVRRPEIATDVRSFPVGNYLILYRVISDGVVIVRVVHGHRNLARLKLQ